MKISEASFRKNVRGNEGTQYDSRVKRPPVAVFISVRGELSKERNIVLIASEDRGLRRKVSSREDSCIDLVEVDEPGPSYNGRSWTAQHKH